MSSDSPIPKTSPTGGTAESVPVYGRPNRIVSGNDFQRAYSTGNRARGRDLLVVVVPNGLAHTRLGLSVGKRIWKLAVDRNRVRRVFREAFRLALSELPAGIDLVMIPARPALKVNALEVRAELLKLSAKALRRYNDKLQSQGAKGEET
ncbi:MAG: ribonuclease P protein component [Planctomycetota bacterium]|jgi:ribonuclease P protein component